MATLPGWFGKLPGMGDFAHRRLPDSFRAPWDRWLQEGFAQLRVRHDDWTERYLEGPVWFFILAAQVAGAQRWIGVLMPSVDGVGRYFPFTVACEFDGAADELQGDALAAARAWWALAAQAALQGLEDDADAPGFETLLQQFFAGEPQAAVGSADTIALPPAGHSLWLTHPEGGGGLRMTVDGLPRGVRFDALFGFADEVDGHD